MADYYTPGTPATPNTLARAENIAAELVTIKAAFDKIPEQLSLEQGRAVYALDTGAADAYVVALPATLAAYTTGLDIIMKAVNANTGASTLNIDGLGVKSIKRFDGTALVAGDIPAGAMVGLRYDGTNFRLSGNPTVAPLNLGANTVIATGSTAVRSLAKRFEDHYNAEDFEINPSASAANNSTNLNSAIATISAAGGGDIWFTTPGTCEFSATIIPRRGVVCKATFGSVVLKLADAANTVLVESYLFSTLYSASAYQISDNADMTYDYGFDGFIFDGNKANQTSGAYCVKMYGRRLWLTNCIIANSKGVGLWTAQLGAHSSGYDYTKTRTPGLIDNVEIVDCDEEPWIFEGPSDTTIGTVVTNETGDQDNDGTTPQTSTHFAGGDVHGVYVKTGGFNARYLNLNGTRFGRCLYVATGITVYIDQLKVAGGWGNVEIEANSNVQIDRIYSQANPYSWTSVENPHIWNKSDELQVGQCFITRVSGQDNGGDGFYDAGGAQVNNLEINQGFAGHGLVIATNDARFPMVDIAGSTGTAADGNTSAAIRIESGVDWYIGGNLNNNVLGLQNLVDAAVGVCDLTIDCNSATQIAVEGVVIRSEEPSITVNSIEVEYASLEKWRTYIRDSADRDFWIPDLQGNILIADDAAVAIAPPGTTGKIYIYSWGAASVDPNEYFEGYFDAGSSFQLTSLSTGSAATISNSARTGTDGTDAFLNIGGQTDQIHIENRRGGARNIRYRFDV